MANVIFCLRVKVFFQNTISAKTQAITTPEASNGKAIDAGTDFKLLRKKSVVNIFGIPKIIPCPNDLRINLLRLKMMTNKFVMKAELNRIITNKP